MEVAFLIYSAVEINLTEEEIDDLSEQIDLREVILDKRQKMAEPGSSDELVATQQALKRVTNELETMKRKITALESGGEARYALGFDPIEFNKLKFTESLQWVTSTLVVNLKQEMENFPEYFRMVKEIGNVMEIGNKACAGFNRGSACRKKWHTYWRQTGHKDGIVELRLHCCVLCMEGLGILSGHPVINCPWIKLDTWNRIHL